MGKEQYIPLSQSSSWTNRLSPHVSRLLSLAVCAGLIICLPWSAYAGQNESAKEAIPPTSIRAGAAPPQDVAAPSGDLLKTDSGIVMKVLKPGSGSERPTREDCVVLSFTAWKRDGSLFSTSGLAGESAVQCLSTAIPGISEALTWMTTGERRRIWVPAELAFAAHIAHHQHKASMGDPAPQADLTIDLELVRIMRAPPTPPDLEMPPATAFKTPSGVTFDILNQGTGTKHPTMNSRVTLDYSGWTTDGDLFESTVMSGHPAIFLLGTVLPGWREALPYMVTGEKIRLWVPAALAYGDAPVEKQAPAGDLVFEIKLLGFN